MAVDPLQNAAGAGPEKEDLIEEKAAITDHTPDQAFG